MGWGCSPWSLSMLTSAITTAATRKFNIQGISYMDDFLFFHASHRYLKDCLLSIIRSFENAGGAITFDKNSLEPQTEARFLGIQIRQKSLELAAHMKTKLWILFRDMENAIGNFIDSKLCQRICGLLNAVQPFSYGTVNLLKPFYIASVNQKPVFLSKKYFSLLVYTFGSFKPIYRRRHYPRPTVHTDASGVACASANLITGKCIRHEFHNFDLSINRKELIGVLRAADDHLSIATDSTFVLHRRFRTLPFLQGHLAESFLSFRHLFYVNTKFNAADAPSRSRHFSNLILSNVVHFSLSPKFFLRHWNLLERFLFTQKHPYLAKAPPFRDKIKRVSFDI